MSFGRRIPFWARIVLVLGAVLVVASAGTVIGARMLINQATESIPQTTLIEGDARAPERQQGEAIDGAINLLLVGIDAREEGGGSDGDSVRSDTIIILHIPETHDKAYLISIPRDWLVDIPAYSKNNFAGISDKVNTAFSAGYAGDGDRLTKLGRGMELLATTLNKATGIRFNGAAIIDFNGFAGVIHALGGVEMCVAEPAESAHLGVDSAGKLVQGWYSEAYGIQLPYGVRPYVHEAGCRTMNSTEALDYSRIRKSLPNGDYDRQRHQQQLIKAIVEKATTRGVLTDLGRLNDLVAAAGDAFVLDTGGAAIADYVFTLRGLRADDMVLLKTNAGKTNTQIINGTYFEVLDPTSMDMLRAAKDGTLGAFLAEHPEFAAEPAAATPTAKTE
ncbi:LCP family protein required for cell wall assembly [Catenuloplanes nepalensis]|uniref:LCP family protein required for cell wall assembly n=1 Tax=Catenuloplanes nepalensis TaxID=587533 RepID=A0ABT9MPN2_9ACTN|nr:LCP family protein [Catenuloplanes nepalensis]MDP9793362.1 LCP family protein required for cell wall assembly [Catenuloplanes nepalensis]